MAHHYAGSAEPGVDVKPSDGTALYSSRETFSSWNLVTVDTTRPNTFSLTKTIPWRSFLRTVLHVLRYPGGDVIDLRAAGGSVVAPSHRFSAATFAATRSCLEMVALIGFPTNAESRISKT